MSTKKELPAPPQIDGLIDTHCHLDYLKQIDLGTLLKKSQDQMMDYLVTISVDPNNLNAVLDLAKQHAMVYCTQGIHPHDSSLFNQEVENQILKNLASCPKVVAIGEIGLDYHYNHSPKDIQIQVFTRQLEIAIDHNLPVVIHTREAEKDTMDILKQFLPKLKKKGVLHSFTSSLELAEFAIQNGLYLGFNGIITFKNSVHLQDVVKITPLENIVLETDAPFLAPVPYRGQENNPLLLGFVAQKVAEIKQIDIHTLVQAVSKNSRQLFQFL